MALRTYSSRGMLCNRACTPGAPNLGCPVHGGEAVQKAWALADARYYAAEDERLLGPERGA